MIEDERSPYVHAEELLLGWSDPVKHGASAPSSADRVTTGGGPLKFSRLQASPWA